MALQSIPEAEAHWARVRAAIPSDFFKYEKPLETPRMNVTDDEEADIERYREIRRMVIAGAKPKGRT